MLGSKVYMSGEAPLGVGKQSLHVRIVRKCLILEQGYGTTLSVNMKVCGMLVISVTNNLPIRVMWSYINVLSMLSKQVLCSQTAG